MHLIKDFDPRRPGGRRLEAHSRESREKYISIHAAGEGGDFQGMIEAVKVGVSIHAAGEGGDPGAQVLDEGGGNFNPRRR